MIVYTQIAGETSPEAVVLTAPEPTIQDLIDAMAATRAAAGRRLSIPSVGDPDESLAKLGIADSDLVTVVAEGSPTYEKATGAEPAAEQPVAQPSSRKADRLNEYEELTQLLQWHAPWHINGDSPSHQVWSDDSTELRSSDWESYRSPDKLYYRTYVSSQAKADRAVSTAFDFAAESGQLESVDSARVERLRGLLPGTQFADWGLCIVHQHTTRFALSSWVAGATDVMMFDELRHAQLYGRLTLNYDEVHGGFDRGQEVWLSEPRFQGSRRVVEELISTLDWGKATILGSLVVEPHITAVQQALLEEGGLAAGDPLTSFVCNSIRHDKRRHRASAGALLRLVSDDTQFGDDNRRIIQGWLAEWLPAVQQAAAQLADGEAAATRALGEVSAEVAEVFKESGIEVGHSVAVGVN